MFLKIFGVLSVILIVAARSPHIHKGRKRKLSVENGWDDETGGLPGAGIDFKAAKMELGHVLNLIYQRYEFWNNDTMPFFEYVSNMPDSAWDILKYKLAMKMLRKENPPPTDPFEATMNDEASNLQKDFLMVFGGSSVTAGHDNYFNESWPIVFERRIRPAFNALGVRLRVHNIAQGANNCFPSNYCYEAMGGSNADFYGWEQSFNCGRAPNVFEHIARLAYWNKAVMYYSASGAFTLGHCPGSNDTLPWIDEKWTPEKAGLREGIKLYNDNFTTVVGDDENHYKSWKFSKVYSRYNVTNRVMEQLKKRLNDQYWSGNSVGRFTGQMYPHYNGVAPHGFSVWTNGPKGAALKFLGVCHSEGGPHWMTREAGTFAKPQGMAWHPTGGLHRMRGEIMVYNYAHIFLDAVNTVEKDLQVAGVDTSIAPLMVPEDKAAPLIEKYHTAVKKLQIPPPSKPLRCSPDCDTYPKCFTNYEPHYNPPFLLSEIVVGKHPSWKYARLEGSGSKSQIYGYLDYRPQYQTKEVTDAHISFKIHIRNRRHPHIKVCSYRNKEALATSRGTKFYLDIYKDPPCSDCRAAGNNTISSKTAGIMHELGLQRTQHRRRYLQAQDVPAANMTALPALKVKANTALDPNVNMTAYVLPPVETLLSLHDRRKYHGDECHFVNNLPLGKHVFTIMTGKAALTRTTSVSHMIVW